MEGRGRCRRLRWEGGGWEWDGMGLEGALALIERVGFKCLADLI